MLEGRSVYIKIIDFLLLVRRLTMAFIAIDRGHLQLKYGNVCDEAAAPLISI